MVELTQPCIHILFILLILNIISKSVTDQCRQKHISFLSTFLQKCHPHPFTMNSCLQFSHAISTVNLFETPSCCPLEFMKLLIQSACTLGKGSIKKQKKSISIFWSDPPTQICYFLPFQFTYHCHPLSPLDLSFYATHHFHKPPS